MIREMLAEGININVTLLFSIEAYEQVAHAYVDALEQRVSEGKPIDRVASVASFFVSRVDTLVDRLLNEKIAEVEDPRDKKALEELRGKAAVANAKLAYAKFEEIFSGPRWDALKAAGARPQRPLWASAGTKNPDYSDVLYVETLIGPHTVNTMPGKTIEAFLDHGVVKRTVDTDLDQARDVISTSKPPASPSTPSPPSSRRRHRIVHPNPSNPARRRGVSAPRWPRLMTSPQTHTKSPVTIQGAGLVLARNDCWRQDVSQKNQPEDRNRRHFFQLR
ncbi:MAG: transaldolase family protein [Thermomicrobiales bacterium]